MPETKTYRQRFAEIQEAQARTPRIEYISNEDFRKQKAALTRALNSGDPLKVLATVEKTVGEGWRGKAWPDDWSRWRNALEDAAAQAFRQARESDDYEEAERLEEIGEELRCASYVIFP